MALDYDRFRKNAQAAGELPEDTENTVKLFKEIEEALTEDPYVAPELGSQEELRVVRLARLFLDRLTEETAKSNVVTARWLRRYSEGSSPDGLALGIERGEHWTWWHTEGKRQS